jgi:hypothetical protein
VVNRGRERVHESILIFVPDICRHRSKVILAPVSPQPFLGRKLGLKLRVFDFALSNDFGLDRFQLLGLIRLQVLVILVPLYPAEI